jgi:hypothetical protein
MFHASHAKRKEREHNRITLKLASESTIILLKFYDETRDSCTTCTILIIKLIKKKISIYLKLKIIKRK